MKKLLFQVLFLLLIIPTFSQGFVSVNGTVTDSQTGVPIANHAVTIRSDSTSGFFYYQVKNTNSQGFYMDTIPVTMGVTGTLFIETVDCNNTLHQDVWNYIPQQTHVSNFSICNTNTGGCQANFSYVIDSSFMVQFTDLSTASPSVISWSWNFGDPASGSNNTSTVQNSAHVFTTPGTYTVCLTIQGSGGCTSVICKAMVVGAAGNCHASYTYTHDTLTSLQTIHFIDQSTTTSGHITTWVWNFGDGQIMSISYPANPNVTHTYASYGTYTVCLSIQGSDSTCYDTECKSVNAGSNTGCLANFTWSDSTNTGNPVQLVDLSQANGSGPVTSWTWNFGDPASGSANTSTQQNPVHQFTTAGTYTVCLTIHGTDSTCHSTTCKTITIGVQGCQANFTYASTAPNFSSIQFTDLSVGNPTGWTWNFGDGSPSSVLENPVHSYTSPGTYTVCLTISGNNCTSTSCQNVVVTDSTNYKMVYGQVYAGNFPVTQGMVMIFSYDTVANYQPYVHVTPIDSNGVYYFTLVPAGDYYILAIPLSAAGYLPTYYGNVISWEQATLIHLGNPVNPYNINLVMPGLFTSGPGSASGQINMGDVSSAMLDKVNMIIRNSQGQPIGFASVTTTGTFSFPTLAYGTYYLHAEMPGVAGDNIMIVLTAEKPNANVVMTFTGHKILGILDQVSPVTSWSVYPNPVRDNFTFSVNMKKGVNALIGIINMTGRMVIERPVSLLTGENKIEISTASLPSGIYTLRLISDEGTQVNARLVKTR